MVPDRAGLGGRVRAVAASALVAEPPLNVLRRVLPRAGGIDFSPLILIIALQIVGSVVLRWQDFGFWTLL